MGDIVNLRQRRKAKARAASAAAAGVNRVAFGRTKAERQITEAERERDRRKLDGLKREHESPDSEPP